MIYEFLTSKNNRTYNLKLAKYLGVYSAVFISMLLEMKEESINLKKSVEDFFILGRPQIYELDRKSVV